MRGKAGIGNLPTTVNHGYKSSILVLIFCSYIRFALITVGTKLLRAMQAPFGSLIFYAYICTGICIYIYIYYIYILYYIILYYIYSIYCRYIYIRMW